MESRRLLPLGVAVTALVVLAGVASRGRPLAGSGAGRARPRASSTTSSRRSSSSSVIVVAVAVWGLLSFRPSDRHAARAQPLSSATLLSVAGGAAIALLLLHAHFLERFRQLDQRANQQHQTGSGRPDVPAAAEHRARRAAPLGRGGDRRRAVRRSDRLRRRGPLEETAALAARGAAARRQAVSVALDESLDDLRNEPDLRRAIIAAYARMEARARRRRARAPPVGGAARVPGARADEPRHELGRGAAPHRPVRMGKVQPP